MQLLELTPYQIRSRCTAQSFERGLAYFHAGTIGNPVLQDWRLSAKCQGSLSRPYRTSVELMPTRIVSARCSCPYDADGDCKHIVALLLTYIEAPKTICCIDGLLATLALKPKSSLPPDHFSTPLKVLYQRCHQENQWDTSLLSFHKQHARKRLLLQIIDGIKFNSRLYRI